MKEKQRLVIKLPANLEDLPVQIIRGSSNKELVFCFQPEEIHAEYSIPSNKKYFLIWCKDDYLKVMSDEILWIEAEGSYSRIYLTEKRNIIVSFHLSIVGEELPKIDFVRIHRSCIINIRHVVSLVGNSFKIDGKILTIGRNYKEDVFDRFIFIGVRRKKK
ncbi:MAG: LytTR family DNA-binding domain-containing protein [Bacteroidales bacterium]